MVAAILDAARAIMRERGVAALSFREVARRVAIQAPSLYEYFPSKAALYDALFLHGIQLFRETCDRAVPDGADFWQRLQAIFEANIGFAREHADLYQLVFERAVPGFVPSAESMAVSQQMLDQFHEQVAAAIDSGAIAPGLNVEQVRDLVIAIMHGLTSQHLANDADAPPGSGRYGGLIAPAMALLRASWAPRDPASAPKPS